MRAKDGHFDWQQLAPAADTTTPVTQTSDTPTSDTEIADTKTTPTANGVPADTVAENTAGKQKPFGFDIGSLRLQNWQIAYVDETFVQPLNASIAGINLGGAIGNADGGIAVRDITAEHGKSTLQSARCDSFALDAMYASMLASVGFVLFSAIAVGLGCSRARSCCGYSAGIMSRSALRSRCTALEALPQALPSILRFHVYALHSARHRRIALVFR